MRLQTGRHTALAFAAIAVIFTCGQRAASGQRPLDFRTPPAPATPRLNGPKVYGVRPGHPFLYRIPCTGGRPMRFSAKNLPLSLKLDRRSGIISGSAPEQSGVYLITHRASNALGKDTRQFRIVLGDEIGLTPQMGWND